jgi:hypothetical protein
MKKITLYFKKAILVFMLASLSLAAFPAASVQAAGLYDDPQPGRGRDYMPRLEKRFEAQQARFDRQTQLLARADTLIERVQSLIDKATEKGLDASAVQAALDDFAAALPAAQAAHARAGALIAAHAGFDDKGKLTELAAAVETVRGIHSAFREFAQTLLPPFKALRQAIRTFVDENNLRRPEAGSSTPVPSNP